MGKRRGRRRNGSGSGCILVAMFTWPIMALFLLIKAVAVVFIYLIGASVGVVIWLAGASVVVFIWGLAMIGRFAVAIVESTWNSSSQNSGNTVAYTGSGNTVAYTGSGYVYLVRQNYTDYYKIGVSTNPKSRIQSLSTASPSGVTAISIVEVHDHYSVEYELHQYYAHKRLNGEWFEFAPSEIVQVIRHIQSKC